MSGADGDREWLGRVLRGAALAACLVALVAVIGPRLASSGGGAPVGALPAGTPGTISLMASTPGGTSAASATTTATTTTATTTTTTTTTASADSSSVVTTAAAASSTSPTSLTPALGSGPDEGAVSVAVLGLHAGTFGPPRSGFFAGEAIGWHFRVTNTGAEYLWGVFVYLEGYGPVVCEARRLEVGAGTDCWAETIATPDQNAGEAWVTAWTSLRMVTDRLSCRILVSAV